MKMSTSREIEFSACLLALFIHEFGWHKFEYCIDGLSPLNAKALALSAYNFIAVNAL